MSDYDARILDHIPRSPKSTAKFHPAAWFIVPLTAILFQVYVPRFIQYLSYLELPLLVTVYFALLLRQPILGSMLGAVIGLAQDSLADHPLGMFGMVKTLVGFLAASVSLRFDVDNTVLRYSVGFLLFTFHQFSFWALAKFLIGQEAQFPIAQTVILAFLNAVVAVPFFLVLDKLRLDGR